MSFGGGLMSIQAMQLRILAKRVEELAKRRSREPKKFDPELLEAVALKLKLGMNVEGNEAAAHLGISERTLRRWEIQGRIRRCDGYGTLLKFAASDVLRLASASSRKGA